MKKIIKKVQCPMCRGNGGYTEAVLDDGSGPFYDCGYCIGEGVMNKDKLFYQCLGWLSAEKRLKKKLRDNKSIIK